MTDVHYGFTKPKPDGSSRRWPPFPEGKTEKKHRCVRAYVRIWGSRQKSSPAIPVVWFYDGNQGRIQVLGGGGTIKDTREVPQSQDTDLLQEWVHWRTPYFEQDDRMPDILIDSYHSFFTKKKEEKNGGSRGVHVHPVDPPPPLNPRLVIPCVKRPRLCMKSTNSSLHNTCSINKDSICAKPGSPPGGTSWFYWWRRLPRSLFW